MAFDPNQPPPARPANLPPPPAAGTTGQYNNPGATAPTITGAGPPAAIKSNLGTTAGATPPAPPGTQGRVQTNTATPEMIAAMKQRVAGGGTANTMAANTGAGTVPPGGGLRGSGFATPTTATLPTAGYAGGGMSEAGFGAPRPPMGGGPSTANLQPQAPQSTSNFGTQTKSASMRGRLP